MSDSKAMKFDGGKLRYDLVDPYALAWLVSTLTYGVAKYAAWNWLKFDKAELREKYYAAAMRHLEAFRMGEDTDPETGMPHVAMLQFNAMVLAATFAPRSLTAIQEATREAIRRWKNTQPQTPTEEREAPPATGKTGDSVVGDPVQCTDRCAGPVVSHRDLAELISMYRKGYWTK